MPSCPKTSLAFAADKAKLYNTCSLGDRSVYFDVSCKPICKVVEDDLEEISAVVSGEMYLDHWEIGTYHCARCERLLCLLLQSPWHRLMNMLYTCRAYVCLHAYLLHGAGTARETSGTVRVLGPRGVGLRRRTP